MSSRPLLLAIAAVTVACSGSQQIGTEEPIELKAKAGSGGLAATGAGCGMAGAGAQSVGGAPGAGGSAAAEGGKTGYETGGTSSGGASLGGTSSGGASVAEGGRAGSDCGAFKVLILSTSLEFSHDSIPDCQYMLGLESAKARALAHWPKATPLSTEWTADLASDDLAQFTDATLKQYSLVFSCNPTGTVFSNNPKVKDKAAAMAAMQHFVENGGAWAGVHSATDFEKTNGFPWFTNTLAGAYFVTHDSDGTIGTVQVDPVNATSTVLNGLSTTYSTQDEWYKMNRDVSAQPGFKILQRLAVDNRPLTWIKEIANPSGGTGGRMFYTVRGHNPTVYKEPEFRKLVLQGILWATHRMN